MVKTESCCFPSESKQQKNQTYATNFDNLRAQNNLIEDKESNIRNTFLKLNPDLGVNNLRQKSQPAAYQYPLIEEEIEE